MKVIHAANELTVILKPDFKTMWLTWDTPKTCFVYQTKVYSLYKPARWSHIFIHIVQKPRLLILWYIPSWPPNFQMCIFFFIFIYQTEIQLHCTTYICESWCTPPLFLFSFFSLSLSFPFYQYLFHHIRIIMFPLRVVMLSSFAYFVNPPVWCFRLVTFFDLIFFWNV